MNVKAERMEQMIQVVNRNLQLVFSGEQEGITPLEVRELEKVDAVIFGHDKFAFEMVHFVKSTLGKKERPSSGSKSTKKLSVEDAWESNFVQGLESLLVECAVVNDDIERDCFVSRVYCWFTEKLQERRDLPRKNAKIENLRASIERLGGDQTHTLRGLDSYEKGIEQADYQEKLNASQNKVYVDPNDRDFPVLPVPDKKSRFGNRQVPAYVKQGFPNVLSGTTGGTSFRPGSTGGDGGMFPKIPGAEDNYGMQHNVPESDAEKAMHELWMARRRQEAFEWKTQQHLALVMDRLALHKSRLESDALRKQESTTMLKAPRERPASADMFNTKANSRNTNSFGGTGSPMASNNRKSTQGLLQGRSNTATVRSATRMFRQHEDSPSPGRKSRRGSPERATSRQPMTRDGSANTGMLGSPQHHSANQVNGDPTQGTTVMMSNRGTEVETNIMSPVRTSITKSTPNAKMPMRFKNALPDEYSMTFSATEHQKFYMQLSDSDDDDVPDRPTLKPVRRTVVATGKGPPKKGGAAAKPEVVFKHERPVDRERPLSAKMFHTVAMNDSEFKVHYRHSNFRRMPLTALQEQWLDEREAHRVKASEEAAKKLLEDAAKKADKKGAKGKKEDGKDGKKDKKDKKNKKDTVKLEEIKVKPKYTSAAQAMQTLFPNFEDDENPSTQGPMRTMQLMEVATILDTFEASDVPIKESALRKALLIPQDRPEAICLENLREEKEGLMVNPNPTEMWRKFTAKKGGKKGGKKKKKA
eukprot:CAMPEP_0184973908 /NCGR_PEP_ID=MMETSP1098-20130426/5512_1 /TAXON_ID=89044 /ORGANISM="Spumella elongata, Strain CCAP 955/1" /LENGTH=756 /DNA_ID=CAMNT_0027496413 /DNA_START=91 /DNA_END=2361 /DNA_ORIENTATION=-